MTFEEKRALYIELTRAVQDGIAWQIALDHPDVSDINEEPNLCEHKHIRVGIDTSKSDQGALARLLIAKGIFSLDEYQDAMNEGMKLEKAMHEAELSKQLGKKITLR